MKHRVLFQICLAPALLAGIVGCGNSDLFRLPEPAVRYVAFGDSTTKGPSERDYLLYVRDSLGLSADAVANEGSGGETTSEGLERLRSLMAAAIFPNAEVLLYWEGAKDLINLIHDLDPLLVLSPESPSYPLTAEVEDRLDAIQANVEAAIQVGRQSGLQVFVATYFSLPNGSFDCEPLLLGILLPPQAANANVYVDMLNDRIRTAASNQGAVLVDVASKDSELRSDPANYHNCNHLSAQGNEIVAEVFVQAITDHPPSP
jgi:hypothetical protein